MVRVKKRWFIIVGVALVLLVVAVMLVVVGPMMAPQPYRMAFLDNLPGDLTPGVTVTVDGAQMQDKHRLGSYSFSFSVNSLGFRGVEVDLEKTPRVIMTIGDGHGFGTSVDGQHTACDELNGLLAQRLADRGFCCVNASLPGMNLEDEYDYLVEKGHRLKPEWFVIMLAQDDVWEMARPVKMRELLRCVVRNRRCALKVMYYRTFHGIFRMRDEVLDGDKPAPVEFRRLTRQYLALFDRLVQYASGWGGKVLVVTERFEFEWLQKELEQRGTPMIVLSELLTEEQITYAVDGHWDAATHRHIAEAIEQHLETVERKTVDKGQQ